MSAPAIAEYRLVEENLRCAMRFFGEATGSGEVRTLEHTVAMYSGLDYGVFNIALLNGVGALDDALEEAERFFKARTQRWSFWLCEDLLDPRTRRRARMALHDYGLRPISHPPGMIAPTLAPPQRHLPPLEVRAVGDPITRQAFAEITSVCFEIPLSVANAVYTPERAWRGDYRGFIGSVNGRPMAIAAMVAAAGVVGIYSLGTLPEYRNHGYGEALMRSAIHAARTRGGEGPLVLQSTEAGHSLYRRMGFRDVTKFSVYLTR